MSEVTAPPAPPLPLCRDCAHFLGSLFKPAEAECARGPGMTNLVNGDTVFPTCESERASLDPESGKCTRKGIFYEPRRTT